MTHISRRGVLGAMGALPFLGEAAARDAQGAPAAARQAGAAADALATEADRKEFARLKALDLGNPEAVARQKGMPVGKIGNLTLGRLISGSNLVSLNMHARDLDYVRSLAARYNTEDRIFMTLKKCEEQGINGIVLKNHNFRQYRLSKYWTEWGGRMRWIADVITTDITKFEALLVEHLDLGASAAYLWGGASDTWYFQRQPVLPQRR